MKAYFAQQLNNMLAIYFDELLVRIKITGQVQYKEIYIEIYIDHHLYKMYKWWSTFRV